MKASIEFPSPLVAVDVDETVADLLGEWLRRYNERSGDALLPEDIDRWYLPDCLLDEWKATPQQFYDILKEDDLYRHVLPIMGARKAVSRLKGAGCRVVFASSCVAGTECHKIAWLRRYGFIEREKQFISTGDKSLVRADYLIDDGVHNVEGFQGTAFLLSQPHNATVELPKGVRRVPSLMAAVDIILSREEVLRLGKTVA